ncbi:MAG TPA: ATPase, T2SS/T4P/T4SS family, partial [Terriglobales bacterium]|nr:ATPase, T2SS/T4P/T4SS family [Terriglobales bacterium]
MESRLTFAERLVESRLLSDQEMDRVLKLQHEQQVSLPRLIVELGFLSEDDLLPVLCDHFKIPLISIKELPATPLPMEFPPGVVEFFKLARMVPVSLEARELVVAVTDPTDLSRLHALELAAGLPVKPVLAKEKDISARIESLFGNGYSAEANQASIVREFEGPVDEEDVAHLRDMASEVPVIRLVNQMLVRALESRASDVHIEPFENHLKVRYRIDGILHEVEPPPRQLKSAVISRLKILAQL